MSQCANERAAEAPGRFPSPAGGSDQTGFLQLDAYKVADQVEINATGCWSPILRSSTSEYQNKEEEEKDGEKNRVRLDQPHRV